MRASSGPPRRPRSCSSKVQRSKVAPGGEASSLATGKHFAFDDGVAHWQAPIDQGLQFGGATVLARDTSLDGLLDLEFRFYTIAGIGMLLVVTEGTRENGKTAASRIDGEVGGALLAQLSPRLFDGVGLGLETGC